jgi:hypothetical protein
MSSIGASESAAVSPRARSWLAKCRTCAATSVLRAKWYPPARMPAARAPSAWPAAALSMKPVDSVSLMLTNVMLLPRTARQSSTRL